MKLFKTVENQFLLEKKEGNVLFVQLVDGSAIAKNTSMISEGLEEMPFESTIFSIAENVKNDVEIISNKDAKELLYKEIEIAVNG